MTTPGISTQNQSRYVAASPSRVAFTSANRVEVNAAVQNRVQQPGIANRVEPNGAVVSCVDVKA